MKIDKLSTIKSILVSLILSAHVTSYAASPSSIEFFASNNTQEISVEAAYARLIGEAQRDLKNSFVQVLQSNHVEQGEFENSLGMYQMLINKNMTSDNTEIFYASPLQNFSNKEVFTLAKQLANVLKQESIAVFIPSDQSVTGEVVVDFKSHHPSIAEVIRQIREKLPNSYATAFSLHLSDTYQHFNEAQVTKIEWLGKNVDINEIKKVFSEEKVSSRQGQAYLVYKDGKVDSL